MTNAPGYFSDHKLQLKTALYRRPQLAKLSKRSAASRRVRLGHNGAARKKNSGVIFFKLWRKANGEKCKVASKFFEAFIGIQQKFHTNIV